MKYPVIRNNRIVFLRKEIGNKSFNEHGNGKTNNGNVKTKIKYKNGGNSKNRVNQ